MRVCADLGRMTGLGKAGSDGFAWSETADIRSHPISSRNLTAPDLARKKERRRCDIAGACGISASLSLGKPATAAITVERIAPQRLHREGGAVRECHVRRSALARRDPGALVADLRAVGIEPAGARELIRNRLGRLVTLDNGDAGIGAQAIEVGAAACTRVGDIRQVGVSDVAVGRAGGAVPRAVLPAEATRTVPRRGRNHILHAVIAASGRVAEILGRTHRLGGQLRLSRMLRRSRAGVIPVAIEHARLVTRGYTGAVAEHGAAGHALTVLGNGVQPGTAAHAGKKGFQKGRFAARVVVDPLRAPKDQIDGRRGLDADPASAAVVAQVVRTAAPRLPMGPTGRTPALRLL